MSFYVINLCKHVCLKKKLQTKWKDKPKCDSEKVGLPFFVNESWWALDEVWLHSLTFLRVVNLLQVVYMISGKSFNGEKEERDKRKGDLAHANAHKAISHKFTCFLHHFQHPHHQSHLSLP